MGYPELPPEENNIDRSGQINFNPPTSEDSDNNEPNIDSAYSGYEQLTFNGETYTGHTLTTNEDSDASEDEDTDEGGDRAENPPPAISYPPDFADIECAGGSSFPDVVPADIEISQQVWNAPPAPNRANTIELDDTRTNQIISLMSGISLPQNCIPEWAQTLPEDKWKQDLLDKIRKNDNKSATNANK